MASCVRNMCTKNYQNPLIGFKVTVENVGDVFLTHSVVTLHRTALCSDKKNWLWARCVM